jgi:hypothetical protein
MYQNLPKPKGPEMQDESAPEANEASLASIRGSNLFYCGKLLVIMVLCFLFFYTGHKWIGRIITSHYHGQVPNGVSLVCRTTCSLAIWYLAHCIVTFNAPNLDDSCHVAIHKSLLWLHSLLYVGLWVGFWFVPDSFFDVYLIIAYVLSGIYLFMQAFFLLDLFHDLNRKLDRADMHGLMLLITLAFWALSITGFALCYWKFAPGNLRALVVLTINLVLCVVLTLMSVLKESGSIFVSAFMGAFVAFLTFSGLVCDTSDRTAEVVFSVLGSVLTLVWLWYVAFARDFGFAALCPCVEEGCCCDEEAQGCHALCKQKTSFSLSAFHGVLALAAVYVAMVATHWGKGIDTPGVNGQLAATWVNFAASWVTMLLYVWILFAPNLFPDRDFGQLEAPLV